MRSTESVIVRDEIRSNSVAIDAPNAEAGGRPSPRRGRFRQAVFQPSEATPTVKPIARLVATKIIRTLRLGTGGLERISAVVSLHVSNA